MTVCQTKKDTLCIKKYHSETNYQNQQLCLKESIKDLEICHSMFLKEMSKLAKILELKNQKNKTDK
jgi:hypothetical protein